MHSSRMLPSAAVAVLLRGGEGGVPGPRGVCFEGACLLRGVCSGGGCLVPGGLLWGVSGPGGGGVSASAGCAWSWGVVSQNALRQTSPL